ncbi:MAG TPA: M3 family oligoendopeptidase [Anaerolineales bacterium]|nr:M3 family oligoendopeptidase [Anaerolineales bacterium]
MYTQTRWSLKDLLPDDSPEAIDAVFKALERRIKAFERWRPQLKPGLSAKAFGELLDAYESMLREAYRVSGFASLRFAADTQDQGAQALRARVNDVMARAQNQTLFFSLWWKKLTDAQAARLMKGTGSRRYFLEEMRHFRKHTLSEPEEKILNLKNANGPTALENIYEQITNKYLFEIEVDGEVKKLTRDVLMMYARHPDPALRAAAYQALYKTYGEDGPLLASIYAALVRDWRVENVDLRKHKSPIGVRNLANDLPDKVVDTLLRVIRKNRGVFQRYFKLKAGWLGLPKLRRYDLYAPLSKSDKEVPYYEAVEMVLATFNEFSPKLGELARQVFDDGHVDAEIRPGKRGGAFCASIFPAMPSFVLLNYSGRVRDVATIAHEFGHAVHATMAGHHSLMTFHSSLPMAETASVFSEMLLTEKLLAAETDPDVRRDLLAAAIDDAYATVGRQGYFSLWEQEAHEMVRQNKTPDEMADRYLETLREQFDDAIDVSDDFKWEWVSIPHFYSTPFYVYAYAFGQLITLGLYRMYKQEGEAFKPKFLKLLSYGGSESPAKICRSAGIDITSEAFWQGGFDVIADMIKQLEALG